MQHEEDKIQSSICTFLSIKKVFYFSVPNSAAGKTSMARAMRLKATGLKAGVADLVVLDKDGRAIFLEVKTQKGRLSPKQLDFKNLCEFLGYPYYVVRSVEDVKPILSYFLKIS